ncbi:MAG: gamma-glutamyl-gamma-aminobutyrate hydrolase family protein [Planctomycetota bacterium]
MPTPPPTTRALPLIGVSADVHEDRARVKRTYSEAIRRVGGVPVVLCPPEDPAHAARAAHEALERLDGLVLTGGDDPLMEPFGRATDPRTTRMHPSRQPFEVALATAALARDTPTLGVCLGMQYLALVTGGDLVQWMPDALPTHRDHWNDARHAVVPETDDLPAGEVTSHHRQAVSDPGALRVLARAHDGVIEAIGDHDRRFVMGVQWHPERTDSHALGDGLYRSLIDACT